MKHCLLISVCCLIVASKFNEKDPHVPDLNSFIRIYNQNSKFYFIFSIDEFRNTEVKIIKLLKYKLNFYSLYQFITFFFANGILFEKNLEQSYLNKKYKFSEKKILEKIYVKSRELLDMMIDDYDKYFLLFNGKDNYITAIEILTWAIESILDIKLIKELINNCFAKVYNINIDYNKHKEINSIINDLYNNIYQNIENNDASNTDATNKINYNFNYGLNIPNSDLEIINRYSKKKNNEDDNFNNNNNKNNSNLFLMSVSNFEQNHKSERLSADIRNKNYKTRYYFKTKYNNKITDYFDDSQDISSINKLNTLMSYDIYNKIKSQKESDENKNNNISDESNDDINNNNKSDKYQKNKNKYLYYGISRNSMIELNSNHFENEKNDKNELYKNYMRNYNEINPYNSKINSGNNYRYYNNNLSSNSTFSKSWVHSNNSQNENNNEMETYPKNILNKTKKIFDAKIENENKKRKNEENENFNFFINSYINKPNYTILKSMINDKKDKNDINQNLSESNILYKLRNNNYRDERGKENNSIIINNNIQINNFNYVGKENNTFNYYYNNSQKNMKEKENMNINIDNYINKKYFNMSNMNNNYYLFNKISKSKNKRKVNFKKNNFLGKNNKENIKQKENIKENNINNNTDFISNIKKMESYKMTKDKNKNLLNLASLETYFDYSLYNRRKNVEPYNKEEYNITRPINYNNMSYVENNENKFNNENNNSLLRANDKFIKLNRDLDISERYRKINSEYNL